jgi:CheY-like chemotaxis protein
MASLVGVVLPHVPELRRYAYLLTGSSEAGDKLVERALGAVAAAPRDLRPETARIDLFRTFDQANGTVSVGGMSIPADPMIRHLQNLGSLPRRILLLATSLGFAIEDIAAIVRRTPAEVTTQLAAARKALARTAAGRILVIEDDALLAAEIVGLVESMGEGVCGSAATFEEALRIAQSSRPALVIADIQLGQQRQAGRDAAFACIERFKSAVIFVTAYPERLIQGGNLSAQPVLTKPYDRNLLQRAISSALMPAA